MEKRKITTDKFISIWMKDVRRGMFNEFRTSGKVIGRVLFFNYDNRTSEDYFVTDNNVGVLKKSIDQILLGDSGISAYAFLSEGNVGLFSNDGDRIDMPDGERKVFCALLYLETRLVSRLEAYPIKSGVISSKPIMSDMDINYPISGLLQRKYRNKLEYLN